MTNLQKAYATEDESGHWYVIPFEMKEDFFRLLELSNDESNENFGDYEREFIEKFDKYRTGGDLNLKQLYAEF